MPNSSLERLLGQHYDLDLAIPRSISNSVKSTPRASSDSIPLQTVYNNNAKEYRQSLSAVDASGIKLLSDHSTSHERRELIAVSILNGNYSDEIGGVTKCSGTISSFERDAAMLSDIVHGPIRCELQRYNFLELSGNAVAVDKRSPRKVADDKCSRRKEDECHERKEVDTFFKFRNRST